MESAKGRRVWIFPDGDRPREGDFPMKGHESILILNLNREPAHVRMSLYFTDQPPVRDIPLTVEGERVRCFRTNNAGDMGGHLVDYARQYAIVLESDCDIVAQYGKLEASDQPIAYYTVMGYHN